MRLIALAAVLGAAAPVAAADAPEPNRIVYWGNLKTGKSVRVVNTTDAEKKAQAQVKALGGDGWVLLENSTKTGFGAAICQRKGDVIQFHTAHGYDSGRDAVGAAKAKANGGGYFCSNALWHVSERPEPRETSVIDYVKGTIRKAVTKPAGQCTWKQPAVSSPSSGGTANRGEKAPAAACPTAKPGQSFKTRYVCMCVRG